MRPVIRFRLPYKERGVRLIGDPHIDHPGHARELLIRDLEDCKKCGDIGIVMGDVWSMILPQDRKRFNSGKYGEKVDAIINRKLDEAEELFAPYADCLDVFMVGNHESAVIRFHAVDPVALLIDRLNRVKKSGALESGRIAHGGYTCWVQLLFDAKLGPRDTSDRSSVSNSMWLHHGAGGAAPVTKGMIDGNRIKQGRLADVYAIAHKHTQIADTDRFEYLDGYGNIKRIVRDYLVVAGYSGCDDEEYPDEDGYVIDWSTEKFYNLEAQGSVKIIFKPCHKFRENVIERTIIRESAA